MALFVMLMWRVFGTGDGVEVERSGTDPDVTTGAVEQTVEPQPRLDGAVKRETIRLPYERETARLGDPAVADDPDANSAQPALQRFARVIVQDAGSVVAGKVTIRFEGLRPLALDARCDEGATSWPCGRAGRSALRRLIRGRTIACERIASLADGEISGRCTVASVSINEWLVRYGWARPLEEQDEVMAAALETARDEGRGQWRRTR